MTNPKAPIANNLFARLQAADFSNHNRANHTFPLCLTQAPPCKTYGFALRNVWFCRLKGMVSPRKTIPFEIPNRTYPLMPNHRQAAKGTVTNKPYAPRHSRRSNTCTTKATDNQTNIHFHLSENTTFPHPPHDTKKGGTEDSELRIFRAALAAVKPQRGVTSPALSAPAFLVSQYAHPCHARHHPR